MNDTWLQQGGRDYGGSKTETHGKRNKEQFVSQKGERQEEKLELEILL